MTRTTKRISFLGAIVTICLIASLVFAHEVKVKIHQREEVMRQNAEEMVELSSENDSLSKQVTESIDSPSKDAKLHELLKLRGEIGQLRQAVANLEKVRTSHQKLLISLGNMKAGIDSSAPSPQTIQAHWPKHQLGFAGNADPVSGLKSALWAMSQGDPNALASSVTPEAKGRLDHEGWYDRRSSEEEIADSAKRIAESLGPAHGFSVIGQKRVSQGLAIFSVYFEGEGKTRRIAMKKVGAEWKFNAMGRAGYNEDDVLNGYVVWP